MSWRQGRDPDNPENTVAGNGSDLVKHATLLTFLDVLATAEPWREQIRLRECHAGRGIYRIGEGDRRRSLLRALHAHDLPLARAQAAALDRLALPHDGGWYAGSSLLATQRLAALPGNHRYEGYEWAPATRAIARGALREALGDELPLELLESLRPDGRFDGETHVAQELPRWDLPDVVLLDPFGLWRRPKLAPRRARYRRIVNAYLERGAGAPPLCWFFAFKTDMGDREAEDRTIVDGYTQLRDALAERQPLEVRWSWGLDCAMWLVVPEGLRVRLANALEAELERLAAAMSAAGEAPTRAPSVTPS